MNACNYLSFHSSEDYLGEGYIGPVIAVDLFVPKLQEFGYKNDARVLDLGCGTGLIGEQLHKRGYTNIDGVDLTPEMLEIAKTKGIYGSLQQGSMGSEQSKELGVAEGKYDAAICIGVFNLAHVQSEGFNDLIHVVKPGGLVCFSIREMSFDAPQCGFQERMNQLSEEGKWEQLSKHYEPRYFDDDGAWFFVYKVL